LACARSRLATASLGGLARHPNFQASIKATRVENIQTISRNIVWPMLRISDSKHIMSKAYFYSTDGTVNGPHSIQEIAELVVEGTVQLEHHLICSGDPDWKTVREFNEVIISIEARKPKEDDGSTDPSSTLTSTEEEKAEAREEQETLRVKRLTRHAMLRSIRSGLDQLWEAQREAIIARIKDDDLDVEYESTRKQHKTIYQSIEDTVVQYWRADGIIASWIKDMTWNDADFTLKFKGKNESEKYEELVVWLTSKNLLALPAVYCFISGKEYIYVGQARDLGARLKQHEQKIFFSRADRFRVVIPQNKRMLNKLERLVILNRQPTENRSPGVAKNNPADDCLDFIKKEVKELISDF